MSGVPLFVAVSAASSTVVSVLVLLLVLGLDLAGVVAGRETSAIEASPLSVSSSSTISSDFSSKFTASQRWKGNLTRNDFLDFLTELCFGVAFFGDSVCLVAVAARGAVTRLA